MNNMEFYEDLTRCRDGTVIITAFDQENNISLFRSNDPAVLKSHVERLSQTHKAVYVNTNLMVTELPDGMRGADDDVLAINAIPCDCDIAGPAHVEKKLPENADRVLELLNPFPKPTYLIDSGHGLYPMWFFSKPAMLNEGENRKYIKGILNGFGKAIISEFANHGYKLDNVFSESHMFRAPGSLNKKLDTPAKCHVLWNSGIYYSLEDFMTYYREPETIEHEPFEVDARYVGSADRIMERCSFVRKLVEDPEGVTEPEWKAMCDNIAPALDGPEKFHDWSSLYSGYSVEETDYKINRALASKKPCTCEYIHNKLGFPCPKEGCGVKAPIVHTLLSPEERIHNLLEKRNVTEEDVLEKFFLEQAAYAMEYLPAEYSKLKLRVRKTGISLRDFERAVRSEQEKRETPEFEPEPAEICLNAIELHGAKEPPGYRISMEEGISVLHTQKGASVCLPLCDAPVVITRRLENIDSGQERIELAYYRNGRWKTVTESRSVVLNKNKLIMLADGGVPVSSGNAEDMVRYLTEYEAENKNRIPFVQSIGRIGWIGKQEFFPCCTAGEIVFEDMENKNTVDAISECGDFDLWMNTASELRKNPFARILMATSFASPLLELLKHRNVMLHVWFSSGSGKTASLKFAISVWGDPIRLLGTYNTTAVGLERRAGTLKHLPLGLDELQVLNDKRLSPSMIVYSLGNGYGKTRGSKNGGLQEVPTWRNCIISTGEQPLTSDSTMDGVGNRVLELYGAPIPDGQFGRNVHQISESNYGFAGKRFLDFIINTILPYEEKMQHDYETIRKKILAGFGKDPGIHLDSIAVITLGDYYASQCLFGKSEDEALDEAVFLGTLVLQNTKSLEREDVVERAWQFVVDWVATNRTRFDSAISPCYGKIEVNKVYVLASVLRQAMEDGGYSYTKSIRGFRDRGYIDTFENAEGKENVQCQKKIQGINARTICLRLDVTPETDDFLL